MLSLRFNHKWYYHNYGDITHSVISFNGQLISVTGCYNSTGENAMLSDQLSVGNFISRLKYMYMFKMTVKS